jgi:outer membrane receptor for ferrienterochelin and colicins
MPKRASIYLAAVVALTSLVHAGPVDWRPDAKRALRQARKAEKPVLLNIGAAWCETCREMDATTLADPAVVEALRGLATVKVDSDEDPDLARAYRAEELPTLVVLSTDGEILARSHGKVTAADFLSMLEGAGVGCDLEGFVTDAMGDRVEASLLILPQNLEAATEADGYYCLRDLNPGPVELIAESEGRIARSAVSLDSDGGRVRHDLRFSDGIHHSVVVTGTRTQKLLGEAPVRTEVVTRERIDESASRTLAEAVEYTPGVRVESNCQNCNFSQIRMLGLEGAYTQILIDGSPQWSPMSMVYGIEQIPTRLIGRLELVKGGGSTLYGPGAVGGVINVIPRRPGSSGGVIELRGESFEEGGAHSINGAWDWVSADGRSFVSLYGQDDAIPGQDLSGDGFTEISERELASVGLRARHSVLDGRGSFTADVGYYDSVRRGGDRIGLPPEQAELAEQIETDRRSVSLRWSHDATERTSYHVQTSYVGTERDTYYGGGMDPNAYGSSDNPLVLGEAQVNHTVGDHVVSWGTQVQSDQVKDEQPAIGRKLDETYANVGLFGQDDWTLSPTKSLVYGLRVDQHSEIDDPIFSPRAAFRWSPRDELTWRSSFSTGFRPPAVFDEDLHIELAGGSQRQIVLDEDLREERSLSLMSGVEWVPEIDEKFYLIEANVFHTSLDDVFEQEQIAPNVFEKRNVGSAAVYGVELGLGFDLPRLVTVELGWVTQRARFEDPEADFGSRDFFRTPNDHGVLNVSFRSALLGQAFLGLRYTGTMKVPRFYFDAAGDPTGQELVDTPDFLTLDASVARGFDVGSRGSKIRIQLGVRNLTDAFQDDIDQGANRDSDYVYGPRYPRSVYLQTSFTY